jgi:DNA (cytosine-5)-methyltransferase 1
LAIDVRDHGAASRFLRVDRGAFVLKEALPAALYNDTEAYAAAWTRNLIAAGEVAAGVVDERSIRDLKPADVASFRQFHAFSGIAVWSRALRDAGIPDDAPVWSGSAPCQGMSQAGKRRGFADERHLWPDWFRLIRACRPALLFCEQVSSKDGLAWLDLVLADLEGEDYSIRTIDTCAAGVGAPHIRQRSYIVAIARERGREILSASWLHDYGQRRDDAARCSSAVGGVAPNSSRGSSASLGDACVDRVGEHARELRRDEAQHEERPAHGDHASVVAGQAYKAGDRIRLDEPTWGGAVGGHWANGVEWIYCRPAPGHKNGCWRPVEPCTQPLVDESTEGMGGPRTKRLRGYGNAIVRSQAQVFIEAALDSLLDDAVRLGIRAEKRAA